MYCTLFLPSLSSLGRTSSRLHMALSEARGLCSSSCATVSSRLVPVPRLAARAASQQTSESLITFEHDLLNS